MRQIADGLWQGSIHDLNSLRDKTIRERHNFALAVNVGTTPFVPRLVPTLYIPMRDLAGDDDPQRTENDWQLILDALLVTLGVISRGGNVLVTCDAGISRSVVFSAMAISITEGVPMVTERAIYGFPTTGVNDNLIERVKTPGELEPSFTLWRDAAEAVESVRNEIRKLGGFP